MVLVSMGSTLVSCTAFLQLSLEETGLPFCPCHGESQRDEKSFLHSGVKL